MRATLKQWLLFCYGGPRHQEANSGGLAVEVEPCCQYSVKFVAIWQTATEGPSNIGVRVKQKSVIEFLHAEVAPIDFHWCCWNLCRPINGCQHRGAVGTVCSSTGDSDGGFPPLVLINEAPWIMFITSENAQPVVGTVKKKQQQKTKPGDPCFVAEDLLYQIVSLCYLCLL